MILRCTLLLMAIGLCFGFHDADAQFPVTLTLDSRSAAPVYTPPTRADARYRVTVSGTYSQWPQFADCHGVDAVWVYDVPQEEIDAFRWPPRTILGRPFVEIPHWVGDSTSYAFPPRGLGIEPLFEISFRKYLGFRMDGEPFPALPIDPVLHRYQQFRAGTGSPFEFRIIDSTLVLQVGTPVARHEDNCGSLTVTVEEILPTEVNICDVEPIVVGGETIGLRVDAGVFEVDSMSVTGRRNVLTSKDAIGIVSDGTFICPDSLVCDVARTKPLAIGLLVDHSGSMAEDVEFEGARVDKIAAVKRALREMVKVLIPGDSIFLMRFNDTVSLALDWTADTNRISAAVDALYAWGRTAFHRAMLESLTKMSTHKAPYRVLIALSDGANNEPPLTEDGVLDALRSTNIPVYLVAFGFPTDSTNIAGLESMKRFVAAAPVGRLFQITTGDALVKLYRELAGTTAGDDCCRLYFRVPPCKPGQSKRNLRLVYVKGDEIVTKNIVLECDLKVVGVRVDDVDDTQPADMLQADPTPTMDAASISIDLATPTRVSYELYTINGTRVMSADLGVRDIGHTSITIPVVDLSSGVYICRLAVGSVHRTSTIIVQH